MQGSHSLVCLDRRNRLDATPTAGTIFRGGGGGGETLAVEVSVEPHG